MPLHPEVASSDRLRRARRATRAFFLVAGIGMSSWAPMVPYAKARLGLDEAELGIVLLCMGIGSAASMPLAGYLSHRHGPRSVLGLGALAICVTLPLLTIAPTTILLAAALVLFGGSLGVVDVAMNAHAVDVERLHGAPIMSGFHGLFSLGGLAGSFGMAALLNAGAELHVGALAVALALALIAIGQQRNLISVPHDPEVAVRSAFARPQPIAIFLGLLCLAIFLAEGAMLDWAAQFLHAARGVALADAGIGYAAFSIAMAAGRLLGDRITSALGPVRVVRWGGAIAAAGFALACGVPSLAASLVGFVLVGIGASNIVPVLFSAAGRIPGSSAGVAIATVTTLGYAGMLAGPALVGVVARHTSLSIALGGVAVLLAAVAACASLVASDQLVKESP